jgi:hypothetical protein
MFEVTKAEEEAATPATSPPPSPGAAKPASALRVTVPSELQGVAYIEVLCQKGECRASGMAGLHKLRVNAKCFSISLLVVCKNCYRQRPPV